MEADIFFGRTVQFLLVPFAFAQNIWRLHALLSENQDEGFSSFAQGHLAQQNQQGFWLYSDPSQQLFEAQTSGTTRILALVAFTVSWLSDFAAKKSEKNKMDLL